MQNKRRVLLLIPCMRGGGAERVLGILAGEIAKAGFDTELMLTHQKLCDAVGYDLDEHVRLYSMDKIRKADSFFEKLHYGFIEIYTRFLCSTMEIFGCKVPYSLAYRTFMWQHYSSVRDLRQYLIDNPDMTIIAFLQPTVNITLLSVDGLPNRVIISERADPARYCRNRYMPYFAKVWYPHADALVFQTENAKDYFSDEVKKKSHVISNPLNPSLPEPYAGIRNKTIVNFCRITPQKNLPLLINAFSMLLKEYPEYSLCIFGEGEGENDIRKYIKGNGLSEKVILKPFDGNVHEKILNSMMFVSSSDYEGMSNSMLEAMAIGLPTICTDCPAGGARAIICDHKNGILVPVRDAHALYKAMKEIIENPILAKNLSINGAKLREELAVGKIMQQWISLI